MKTRVLILISTLTIFSTNVMAQPGLPGDPSQAPIQGLSLLALAGGAYALKKLKDYKSDSSH